jgi:hypothetical protein
VRRLSFLMVLSIGVSNAIAFPVSAHADEEMHNWCSTGFGSPAEFSRYSKGKGGWLLKIAGRPDEWFDDEAGELTSAEVIVWVEGMAQPQQQVWIIRDRIFWPCK